MGLIDYALTVAEVLEEMGIRYALVGGLACILMGIRRVTEDADFIIELKSTSEAKELAHMLNNAGFHLPVREVCKAYNDKSHFTILIDTYRMDFKIAKNHLDYETLKTAVKVHIKCRYLRMARLEENIVAKVTVLKSIKDLEDALKLMIIYYDKLNWNRICELAGCDLKYEVISLIKTIEKEFKHDENVQAKITELKQLFKKLFEKEN